jgi:hypothetical protein
MHSLCWKDILIFRISIPYKITLQHTSPDPIYICKCFRVEENEEEGRPQRSWMLASSSMQL